MSTNRARPDESHATAHVGDLLARLTEGGGADGLSRAERGRALRSLTGLLVGSARTAGRASLLGGRWLTETLIDLAPRIPLRDLETLRAQHHGLHGDDLAQAIISGATKATAAVGAAGGLLAALEFAAPPMLLTAPAQIAAETLLVAIIEIKLIAELHEVYGRPATGSSRQRGTAYLMSWTSRRGVNPRDLPSVALSTTSVAQRALRKRLVHRAGRNLTTLGPMMSGALAGSLLNHRETRRLGEEIRDDLRR